MVCIDNKRTVIKKYYKICINTRIIKWFMSNEKLKIDYDIKIESGIKIG